VVRQSYNIMLCIILVGNISVNAYAADNQCIPIGGTFLGEAVDETNRIVAATGDFTGAYVKVIGKKPTETGFIMNTEHHLVNGKSGAIMTKDDIILTAIPGKDQIYMVETIYNVIESKGTFANYKGKFNSFGLNNRGKSILHYFGELCK
jgi:hypothetical protein